jgi:hypothetical protein
MLRRHAPDVVSLVFGTLFAGFAVIWLLNATDVIDSESAWLAGPAILIVAGILGLVVALRPSESSPTPVPRAGEAVGAMGGMAGAAARPVAPDPSQTDVPPKDEDTQDEDGHADRNE